MPLLSSAAGARLVVVARRSKLGTLKPPIVGFEVEGSWKARRDEADATLADSARLRERRSMMGLGFGRRRGLR